MPVPLFDTSTPLAPLEAEIRERVLAIIAVHLFGNVAPVFFPFKNLGAFGDGGAVTTHDPAPRSRSRRRAPRPPGTCTSRARRAPTS